MTLLRARGGRLAHPLVLGAAFTVTLVIAEVVEFLASAIYFVDRGLFAGHVGWLAEVAAARGASGTALPDVLDAFRAELHDFPFAAVCLDGGHEVLRRPAMNGAVHSRGEGPR